MDLSFENNKCTKLNKGKLIYNFTVLYEQTLCKLELRRSLAELSTLNLNGKSRIIKRHRWDYFTQSKAKLHVF
jgi:hypothetical protein